MKVNKKTKQQVVWVEETRSVELRTEQKLELCATMGADDSIAENPELMAIAIEFRLKPLVSASSVEGASRKSEGESKAYGQLKQDCAALQNEHPN